MIRLARAKVYQVVGQTDLAMADLNRALELNPQSTEALYMRGITLLDKRQTAEALKALHLAAEHGDMDAVKKLGDLYTSGDLGVPLNVEEGMKLWEKAAYFWDENASFALAGTYARGLGVKVDNAAAVSYLRIAAEQGHGLAINNLGLMLWYGRGTPANREEAVQLWVIGAKKNIWQSKHNLQFFLSPLERFKLAFHYPQLFLEDKKVVWISIASTLVLVLVVVLLVIVSLRLARTRNTGR
jgi:TPR repeat protein